MKSWSTGAPNPRGDLYVDETPVKKIEEEEAELATRYVKRVAPPDLVDEALDWLGLT